MDNVFIEETVFPDCNGNGAPDECDIAAGSSGDCNTNGAPDECESDFDGDGLIDDCDPDIDDDSVPNAPDVCDYTPPESIAIGRVILDAGHSLYGTIREDLDGDCDCDLADYGVFQFGFTGPYR